MSQFSLLRSRQHGFLPRRSTLTNLLVVEELITKRLNEGSAGDVIYQDFSRVFDSVNHRFLLHKLRGYGIVPIVMSWAECFLSRRTFRVNINGTQSRMAEAISGVPQSPILFVIYVNDLSDHLLADSLFCADGVKLITHRNHHNVLQNSRNVSTSWSKDWYLDLNCTKSVCLPIGDSPNFATNTLPSSNSPNTQTIPTASTTNYLKHQAQCWR